MNENIVKKFHGVPQHVKAAISRPEVLEKLERLEDTYNVSLAETLIRLATKDIPLDALPEHLTATFSLSPNETKELTASLTKDILAPILSYLNEPAITIKPSAQPLAQPQRTVAAPVAPRRVEDVRPWTAPTASPQTPRPSPLFDTSTKSPYVSVPRSPAAPIPQQPRTAPPPPKLPVESAPFAQTPVQQPKIAAPAAELRLPSPPAGPAASAAAPRKSGPPLAPPHPPAPPVAPRPIAPVIPPQRQEAASKPAAGRTVASYSISPEDELDIAKHRDRLAQMIGASPTADLEQVIAGLIRRRALTFATPVLEKRFITGVLSRLRDVRTSTALQELLERSEKIGGLGFSPNLVQSVIADVDGLARQLHEQGVLPPPAVKPTPRPAPSVPSRPAEMRTTPVSPLPFSAVLKGVAAPAVAKPVPTMAPSVPRPPSFSREAGPPFPPQRPVAPPRAQGLVREVGIPTAQKAPQAERTQMRRPATTPQHGRPMMADVTVPRQKPMGPVDELAALTVQEFRALAPNPRDAANKILEKIDLLTEESYPLRAESVKAWRTSPLFRLYVELGQESLTREKTIEEIITARQETGAPSLSLQEFAIIADINKHLIP